MSVEKELEGTAKETLRLAPEPFGTYSVSMYSAMASSRTFSTATSGA